MGKIFRRRGTALTSGILCLLAAAVIVTVLINDPHKPNTRPWSAWVQANFSRTIEVKGVQQLLPKTGWTYFGLFKGYKEKSFSGDYQGLRKEYFDAYHLMNLYYTIQDVEFCNQSGEILLKHVAFLTVRKLKMGKIFRRNSLCFIAGLIAACTIGIITYALVSEKWVSCKLTRVLSSDATVVNNTAPTFDGGWKEFGLFKGCKLRKPHRNTKSSRKFCFQVFKEFDGVFNLKVLYAVIAFLGIAGIVLLLCAGLSFYNEFTKSSFVLLGSLGLYILNGLAFFFMLCSVALFSGLYHQQIRKNVLTDAELQSNFKSEDNTSLKFSFWVLVAACFLPLINMALTFLNSARAKTYLNKTTTIPTTNVDGMMLY